jgi:hypothetical protein
VGLEGKASHKHSGFWAKDNETAISRWPGFELSRSRIQDRPIVSHPESNSDWSA